MCDGRFLVYIQHFSNCISYTVSNRGVYSWNVEESDYCHLKHCTSTCLEWLMKVTELSARIAGFRVNNNRKRGPTEFGAGVATTTPGFMDGRVTFYVDFSPL